ncbi:hypothetical protein [Paraurantiacibacter namhicola]|uniref:Peptidase C39-like domain-containing protein n=1 Tax=Paraurantiacibacter namhicola TaxID=645517 RepID=A0A1C7DB70_9SPHN|nr:hypothetical protein [Paraurantiacibacter namhicola]ANU08694.1 hypothetical protein A6F65_02413 [Paraurantiacibacter namhicola]
MADDILPQSFRLPASKRLLPIQQGELDGLCGIYSLINAIRLLKTEAGTLGRYDSATLFSFAIYRLAERGDLRERLNTGIPWTMLKRIGERVARVASDDRLQMTIAPIHRGSPDRLDVIKRTLLQGRPIIASVHRHEHYTVLAGYSRTRAIIFDSSGGHWVPLSSIRRSLCLAVAARR